MGVRLLVETDHPAVLEACRVSFGGYGPAEPHGRLLRLRFFVDPEFKEAPPWPQPVYRGNSDLFYISVGCQNTALADLERGVAIAFITPAMASDDATLRRVFLDCLVLTMLTHGRKGPFSYVHASAVARHGRGLLFSGPSESGKSSIAYACVRRGFRFISDDVVYLRSENDDLAAWGRPWRTRLLTGALDLFPELAAEPPQLRTTGEPGVLELDLEEFLPGRSCVRCDPAGVFFLERTTGKPSLDEISEDKATGLLARDLLYDVPEALARHRSNWRRLVRRGARILRSGSEIEAAVDLVEKYLGSARNFAD
jgi:hypothetical protein